MAEEKDPKVVNALKQEVLRQVKDNLRKQMPALFDTEKYMKSVRDRFIENVGGSVTLNALRKAGVLGRPKKDKQKDQAFKKNEDALVELRREIRQLRTLLQRNQQLMTSAQRGGQAAPGGQPTFSPSAVQQKMGRVGVLGGKYLFDKATRRYTTPSGQPVATQEVKQQIAGSPEGGGFSGLGLGAGALAATGLGVFFGGRRRALAAGARFLKSVGVPQFGRRAIMQGAGKTLVRSVVRSGAFRLLFGNKISLGLTAAAALLIPKEIRTIIGGVLQGVLEGIGFDDDLIEEIKSPLRAIFDLIDGFKDFLKKFFNLFFTPEGREKLKQAIISTEGVPGSSLETEFGRLFGSNAPSPEPPAKPPAAQDQRGNYDAARKQLQDVNKDLDDKLKIYKRIIDNNEFPPKATQDQKNAFKQGVGKLQELKTKIDDQLKTAAQPGADYKLEADKINYLANVVREDTGKIRTLFKDMEAGREGAAVPPTPESLPPGTPPQGGAATPTPSPATAGPTPGGAAAPTPGEGGAGSKPEGEPLSTPAGAPVQSGGGTPVVTSGGAPVAAGDQPPQSPSMEPSTEPSQGGQSIPPTPTEPPPGAPALVDPQASRSVEPVPTPPTIGGEALNDRSQRIAQMRLQPGMQGPITQNFDNSQVQSDPDNFADRYIPTPVASRGDIDIGTIFSPVA